MLARKHIISIFIRHVGVLPQTNKIPHFNYHLASQLSMRSGDVELDGEIIHKIGNIDELYYEFSYTPDLKKSGVLPEEFI